MDDADTAAGRGRSAPADSARSGPGGRRPAPGFPRLLALAAAALLAAGARAEAQEAVRGDEAVLPGDTAEAAEVAGLRFGSWRVTGLERQPDASYSTIPVMDVFYQRALGERTMLHLGLSLWRRGRVSGSGTVGMWVGPLYAGLKYYPLGGEASRLDPYLSLAAGPALGFEQRRSSGVGSLESGWTAAVGPGGEAGAGVEVDLGGNVGLTADARYQWVRYLAGELDSPDTYRGMEVGAGITFRLNLR